MVTPTRKKTSCFIAAPPDADVTTVTDALIRRGINFFSVPVMSQISLGGFQNLTSAIRDADFVCVVLPPGPGPSPYVWMEAGLALGLEKPVLFVANEASNIPVDLSSSSVAPFLGDPAVFDVHLDAFLVKLPSASTRSRTSRRPLSTQPSKEFNSEWARLRLARISHALLTGPLPQVAATAETFIAELFQRYGFIVTASPSGSDFGPDLAIWNADIERNFGRPIFVEIKLYRSLSARRIRETEERLRKILVEQHMSIGLAVYFGSALSTAFPLTKQRPRVWHIGARELIRLFADGTFWSGLLSHAGVRRDR